MSKPGANSRDDYRHFRQIQTRWMDNDVYGHVNYYSYFDTAVNGFLLSQGVLDYERGETIGLVVETRCNYFAPIAFPDVIEAGVRVTRLGASSVRYEVGLFREGEPYAGDAGAFRACLRGARIPSSSIDVQCAALAPLLVNSD